MKALFTIIFILFISGCATSQAPNSKASNNLQMRVSELERQLVQRNQEVEELKYEVKELVYQVETIDTSSVIEPAQIYKSKKTSSKKSSKKTKKNAKDEEIIRVDVNPKQVQKALKNAGYYKGSIDGKIGKNTQKAIKNFQKDHNLKNDGIIGRKTWFEMKNYID